MLRLGEEFLTIAKIILAGIVIGDVFGDGEVRYSAIIVAALLWIVGFILVEINKGGKK
ncbi:MAG: hypothetical protein LBH98_02685 [Chitinispirillales bacterium]|jgi:hypothetical protein|nr:hypothetical protein [Chitinispirillales bacterium]